MSFAQDPADPLPSRARPLLSAEQVRLLGCLVEKERTTPDDYPLTANSLMRAANQSTSRVPVVDYPVSLVEREVVELKAMGLLRHVHSPSNRATKYRQTLDEAWRLDQRDLVVLALLMLRGPQTPGELKTRSERMGDLGGLTEVRAVLEGLAARTDPFVVELPRGPGQKEARWAHLLSGEPDPAMLEAAARPTAAGASTALGERVTALEAEVVALRALVGQLCAELGIELPDPVPAVGPSE